MKKIISILLCLAMVLGSFSMAAAINFDDVPEGSYYYEPVYNIAWFGIIGGFPDGTFKPASPITRAQMAVMLVNMQKLSPYTAANPRFSDVPKTHWAYKYVEAAADAGFINGYPDGTFRPDRNVSYDEAITMIVALLGYKLKDLEGTYPTAFTNKARDLGILNTCAILGNSAATRANVSCFLRDALIASWNNYDFFKFVGPDYKITLGPDATYYYNGGENNGYMITLYIENTGSSPISIEPGFFTVQADGKTLAFDANAYTAFTDLKYPSGTISPGSTMQVDLMFVMDETPAEMTVTPNLTSIGEEPVIPLTF
ncbi:MAG: S-layer homology domain-containing protein [Firmicutes bacterium]|nr:S-layer homology domain-containing protein [Bacillota bacterium]